MPNPRSWRFSFRCFHSFRFIFRSRINLHYIYELTLRCDMGHGFYHFTFIKNHVWIYFWKPYFTSLTCVPLLSPEPYCKDWQTIACYINPPWHLVLQIKFYRSLAMPIHLSISSGCCLMIVKEVIQCTKLNILLFGHIQKKFVDLCYSVLILLLSLEISQCESISFVLWNCFWLF